MGTEIKFTKSQISRFKKLGVLAVYLYGSRVTGLAREDSDIDIGVVFSDPESHKNKTMKSYSELYDILTDVFPNQKIDAVLLQFASITLQFKAVSEGAILYEQEKGANFDYKESIIKAYADVKYFLDLKKQAVLDRI